MLHSLSETPWRVVELPMAVVLLAASNPLLPFWSFLSQSRWRVALVSQTSLQLPTSKLKWTLQCVRLTQNPIALITMASLSNSIHALCKNINSITKHTSDVFIQHFRKMLLYTWVYVVAYSYLLCIYSWLGRGGGVPPPVPPPTTDHSSGCFIVTFLTRPFFSKLCNRMLMFFLPWNPVFLVHQFATKRSLSLGSAETQAPHLPLAAAVWPSFT